MGNLFRLPILKFFKECKMDILGILFILWAIVTIFEVVIISGMKVSTFKYVKLLKFLEFFYVVLIIIQINFYLYINVEIFFIFKLFTFSDNIFWNFNI